MINEIFEFLSYGFVLRALLVGVLISICAALLGTNLVLKRFSSLGDGLSHVGFGASALGVSFGVAPLYIAIPAVLLAAFFLLRLNKNGKIKGDAAIALVSSSALAIGITAAKLSHGMNVDINNFMFGSIYTISGQDVVISVALCAVVLILFSLFYNKLFAVTFDESFSFATGIKVSRYNTLLACLTAVTVVIGMRMMGALLISSLLVFPSLSSGRIFRSYRGVILGALLVSVSAFLIGIALSFVFSTPPGAAVVIANLVFFLIFWAIGAIKSRLGRKR
ncbi:MAG: metal ABC transporter permease [Clostridia bacterium]|nr:metal ABC transporter permease [Clostridia bacterium]